MTPTEALPTPEAFPAFPYDPPYPIQLQLMQHLYASIENRQVTIVESPTGTGKTLSLLCSSLTWLSDNQNRARKLKLSVPENEQEVDWVVAQSMDRRRRQLEVEEADYEARLAAARKKEIIMKKMAKQKVTKKPRLQHGFAQVDDSAYLPDDASSPQDENISPAVLALMRSMERRPDRIIETEDQVTCTKIYYASRTHSQLSQIIPELRRLKMSVVNPQLAPTKISSSTVPQNRNVSLVDDWEEDQLAANHTRTISLASRKQLCINDHLRATVKDLDEGCRTFLEGKRKEKCPFLPDVGDEASMLGLRDQILASPKDIEDLASLGRLANVCPYFGSRHAISQAQLVVLPYNLLLHSASREALGIDLRDQIVIIDEAHNLIPTLLSLSSVHISSAALATSLGQISIYLKRFHSRLTPSNLLHLKRLIAFLVAISKYMSYWKGHRTRPSEQTEVMSVVELIHRLGRNVEGINLLEIKQYLKSSKIARKIASYNDSIAEKTVTNCAHEKSSSTFHLMESFLLALSAPADDGCIILSSIDSSDCSQVNIKYQLLNPSRYFQEVVTLARSVVLAGGTMSPISDIKSQLFSSLSSEQFTTFSCDHIIPSSNLEVVVLSKGPRGLEFEFKYHQQSNEVMIGELGQAILNLTKIVPKGMVVFFPSYGFLNTAIKMWTKTSMLAKFASKKKVLCEPQDSANVEEVLQQYAEGISKANSAQTGVMLLAVIGAKLSEGLNFSDDLARAIIIIGLPFANLHSPELQERMKYVNKMHSSTDAATELYENMCMSAVNQSLGRAVRHKNDWAALILIDQRYISASISSKLPIWIGSKIHSTSTFGKAMKTLATFFLHKTY